MKDWSMPDLTEYLKRWPYGFTRVANASAFGFSFETEHFLSNVGLPRNLQPEWEFYAELFPLPTIGVQIGLHGVFPLLVTKRDTVEKISFDHSKLYINNSIVQFAMCLTLRKLAGRDRFPLRNQEDLAELRRAFTEIDSTALRDGCFWSSYLESISEEIDEICE